MKNRFRSEKQNIEDMYESGELKYVPKQAVYAHPVIAELCVQMAHDVYEESASLYNNWYHMNPDRSAFVDKCAPTLIQEARQILASMLHEDAYGVTLKEKEEIFEALMMDATLPGADKRGAITQPNRHQRRAAAKLH